MSYWRHGVAAGVRGYYPFENCWLMKRRLDIVLRRTA